MIKIKNKRRKGGYKTSSHRARFAIAPGEISSRVARGAAMAAAWLSLLVRRWGMFAAKVGLLLSSQHPFYAQDQQRSQQ